MQKLKIETTGSGQAGTLSRNKIKQSIWDVSPCAVELPPCCALLKACLKMLMASQLPEIVARGVSLWNCLTISCNLSFSARCCNMDSRSLHRSVDDMHVGDFHSTFAGYQRQIRCMCCEVEPKGALALWLKMSFGMTHLIISTCCASGISMKLMVWEVASCCAANDLIDATTCNACVQFWCIGLGAETSQLRVATYMRSNQ